MGANAPEGKGKYRVLSEINVTPFVDVMLVLLIIFMVTAPLLQQGIDISLPKTKSSGTRPSKNPFILKIKKNKKIYIGTKTIPLKQLDKKLKAIFQNRSSKQIYIQADRSVPYGIVANALAEIKSSGLTEISFVTTTK